MVMRLLGGDGAVVEAGLREKAFVHPKARFMMKKCFKKKLNTLLERVSKSCS
jgi:hypothetical protein